MMGVKSQKHMGYSLSENAGPWHKYEEFVLDLCKRKSALPKQELLEKWSLVKRHKKWWTCCLWRGQHDTWVCLLH